MAKDATSIDELLVSLGRGTVAPIYLLYGEEDFLIDEGVRTIIEAVLGDGERGFNLDVISAGERDMREILAIATSFPMMGERRVVVVRDAEKATGKDAEILSAYCENPVRSTCLVLEAGKPDFRKKPFVTLKRSGVVVESKPLYENQVPAWIMARVQKMKRTVTPDACKLLTAYVGSSLRGIQNELDKLSISIGNRTEITADDVASVVGMSKEYSVFELQKAIGERDLHRAVEIVEHMLDAGQSVPFIVAMLTNYFTALWKLHDMHRKGVPPREQASQARIHPYFFQEYAAATGRFAAAEVERAFGLLAAADEQAKFTSMDQGQILTGLMVQLLARAEPTLFA